MNGNGPLPAFPNSPDMLKIPDQLTTSRLKLRPFRAEDFPGFLEFMIDREATRHLHFSSEQRNPEGARRLFDGILASYETEEPAFALAIEILDGTYIGSCGLSPIPGEGSYECYYSLNPPFWGQGFASEALGELIRFAFRNRKVKEVRAYVNPANPRSGLVARRVGMKVLGEEKHPVFGKEGIVYAISTNQEA